VFCVVILASGSCFDPPEFPVEPQIDLKGIYFGVDPVKTDSIVLSISFKDGDGDLGLRTDQIDYPFHPRNYFLKNNGQLIKVPTIAPFSNIPPIIYRNEGQTGKLATLEDLNDPLYADEMDSYIYPYTCNTYIFDSLSLDFVDKEFVDASYNITDTLTSNCPQPFTPECPEGIYIVKEIWYSKKNPDYDNIEVIFEVRTNTPDPNDPDYEVLDWETVTGTQCGTSYNGRFPVLGDEDKDAPLDGILHYSMKSEGFYFVLGSKTFRLKIKIKDRALHTSNEITTADYTLDKLRR
jgi:hypothetical protein